jgi:hypothetical protein
VGVEDIMGRKKKVENLPKRPCAFCGKMIEAGQPDHKLLKRVVRPNHRYGVPANCTKDTPGMPGTIVEIEDWDVDNPTVQAATMSLEEATEVEVNLHAQAELKKSQEGVLKKMVERGLVAARAEVEAVIRRGKLREQRTIREAVEQASRERAEKEFSDQETPISAKPVE